MGFSLKKLIQSGVQDVENVARPATTAVAHAAGNVAHAATNVTNAVQAAPRVISHEVQQAPSQVLHAVVEPTLHQYGVALPKSVYDIGRGAAASLTHNSVALQHANQAKQKDESEFLSTYTRPLAQTAETIAHPFSTHTVTPTSQEDKTLFGTTPIQNVQAGVKINYQQHHNPFLAAAYGAGQVAQDAAAVAGVKAGVGKGVEAGAKAANTAVDIAERKPFRNISDDELAAASRVNNRLQGWPDQTKPGDTQIYRQVQQKLSADVNDTNAVDNVIMARQAHDVKMQQVHQKMQSLPIGLGTAKVEPTTALVPKENPHLPTITHLPSVGMRIRASDRGNIGTIVSHNADGSARVQFVNRKDKTTFTKTMQPEEMQSLVKTKNQQVSLQQKGQKQIQKSVNPRPLPAEDVASLPANRTTKVQLNTGRLNAPEMHQNTLAVETNGVIEKMSNKDVEKIAKSAGLDLKSHNIQQTRQKIAEQLNVRQDAVRLQREAEEARLSGDNEKAAALLKASAERGRTSRQQGTDLARQLQARRIIANELDTPQQRIFKLLDNAGVNPDVYTKRLANVDFGNAKEVVEAYRDLVPAKFGDWLDKYRYTNMLSSPLTQITNLVGNVQGGALIRPIQKGFEGVIDATHSLATGQKRTRFTGEAAAYTKGFATSLPESLKAFGDVMSGKSLQTNPDFGDLAHAPLATKGIKGTADKVLSFIPKLMEAFDEAGQAGVRKGETAALKYREKKGVNAGDIDQRAQDAADYVLFRNDLGDASQGHLLNAIDFIPQKVQEARNSNNPVIRNSSKFIFPFVKTPVNVSKQMIEYSPLGLLTAAGNADKTAQIAKAVMGSSLVATAAGTLAASDRLTFAQPTDSKEKQKFLAEGKQAYSLKVGNKWISYQRVHPAIAFNLAAVAAVNDALRNGKVDQGIADKALNGLASISRFFVDQSYFKNAQDFLNNASGTGSIGSQATTALASQGSNIANQLVPARAALTWLNNYIDQVQRQPDSSATAVEQFKQQFSSQLPGLSKSVPARKDNLGNDLAKPHPVINNLTPTRVSDEKNDSIKANNALSGEVDRLARNDNTIALSNDRVSSIAGTDVNLNPKQSKALNAQIAKSVTGAWNNLIQTDAYKNLSDEDKRHALSSVKTAYTSAAKRDWGSQNGIALKDKPSSSDVSILEGNNNVSSFAKSKNSQGTYSSSNGSTISSKLTGSSKQVLTKYNAMTAAQRTKAINNQNDFEYKTAQAKYDNDKAQGKLTTAQDIKAKYNLAKLQAGSTFSKNTRDLYGLSTKELYNYVHNDPNGNAIAKQVIAYGDALQNAGISQNKFRNKKGNITLADSSSSSSKSTGTKTKKAKSFNWASQVSTNSSSSKALRSLVSRNYIKSPKKKSKLKVA